MPAVAESGSVSRSRARVHEPVAEAQIVENVEFSGNGGAVQRFELQEDPSFWKDNNVQVVIRIRPLNSSELSLQGQSKCVRQDSSQAITWTGHPESRFTFDLVADEHVSQEKLFKVAGVPMVDNCVAGYNSCMFAYGQTGSGKTHTMLGDLEAGTRRHNVNCGMTPRVFEYLFSRIQKEKESRREEKLQFTCKCSFLEIYNEQILDLLNPSSVNLQIREDAKKGVHVENLVEFEVSSARDVMQQLIQGAANRKVAATNMNRASSRSHSVFTCAIESKWECQGVSHHRFARLNLVDLAGSERQKSSGAEGDRLKEATNINKSLSTLGLVIMNLISVSNKKSQHVPYRDSKLTFLLQDSLGGNSKTIIIANISPSNCCALETLSTLKFAQRAKFIRNNAIINEDASGDVLTMRLQIQQLKKEVSRLRGLIHDGGGALESDVNSLSVAGSPGSFKWDGGQADFSPLTFDKKSSQRKDYEAALVASLRREQEREAALRAMTAGKQAAEQLANQRTEEVQSLKMRLRFREGGIKRLEAVAAGKLSAEKHLSEEKEELLKEIENLRSQIDRNPEVTRFAMENLQLKEELRRLQSFVEEGEREILHEQITILQDKLLEALDWKLMHEKDTNTNLSLSRDSSGNEENEFLRLQAIQNQREIEALRKNLSGSLEAKEKLERRVDELASQLEERKTSAAATAPKEAMQLTQKNSSITSGDDNLSDDQMELKAMVDAIAVASQREAEAHETAIALAKENEELRIKLKVLIDDNNKLIELYEQALSECATRHGEPITCVENQNVNSLEVNENGRECANNEGNRSETKDVDHLENQLQEMHEENEKLMGLYEIAMHERDEIKKMLATHELNMHGIREQEMHEENEKLMGLYERAMQERDDFKKLLAMHELNNSGIREQEMHEENEKLMGLYERAMQERDEFKKLLAMHELNKSGIKEQDIIHEDEGYQKPESKDLPIHEEVAPEMLYLVRDKVELIQEKLLAAGNTVKYFGSLEKATTKVNEIFEKIADMDRGVELKQQEIDALKFILSEEEQAKAVLENKFLALRLVIKRLYSNAQYWEEREARARVRLEGCSSTVEQKKQELGCLKNTWDEIKVALSKAQQSESQLRSDIDCLNSKLQDADVQRKETEKVLFTIDNLDKPVHCFGKASELLKSEEERTRLSAKKKQLREQLSIIQKEITSIKKKSESIDTEIQSLETEINSELVLLKDAETALQRTVEERQALLEMIHLGRTELEDWILQYQNCSFQLNLKQGEVQLCEESLEAELQNLNDLRTEQETAKLEIKQLVETTEQETAKLEIKQLVETNKKCSEISGTHQRSSFTTTSEKVEQDIDFALASLDDAKSLLIIKSGNSMVY